MNKGLQLRTGLIWFKVVDKTRNFGFCKKRETFLPA